MWYRNFLAKLSVHKRPILEIYFGVLKGFRGPCAADSKLVQYQDYGVCKSCCFYQNKTLYFCNVITIFSYLELIYYCFDNKKWYNLGWVHVFSWVVMKSNFTILFAFLLILEHCGPPKLGTYILTYIWKKFRNCSLSLWQ